MDITTLAAWGEFIGGIAVVVSLVYLASQIRHSRDRPLSHSCPAPPPREAHRSSSNGPRSYLRQGDAREPERDYRLSTGSRRRNRCGANPTMTLNTIPFPISAATRSCSSSSTGTAM